MKNSPFSFPAINPASESKQLKILSVEQSVPFTHPETFQKPGKKALILAPIGQEAKIFMSNVVDRIFLIISRIWL